ncbi:MAG: hypothetical protein EBZ48_12150, partial [Proteobacteria bacterium]|nr:hypothetical protein [Pseudomonadota bacterium]
NHLSLRRVFPAAALAAIEQAVQRSEEQHSGEMCVAIEPSLPLLGVLAGMTARQRAVELFSELRVWDTEHNCGVLLYLLLSERKIEVVVDRGIAARVAQDEWDQLCALVAEHCKAGRYQAGVEAGIQKATALLSAHFPRRPGDHNEIANRPVVL